MKLEEFNTLEKIKNLFDSKNCIGNTNCYFVCYQLPNEVASTGGMIGGVGGGLIGGLIGGVILNASNTSNKNILDELKKYNGFLVNWTDNGLGLIPIKYDSIALVVDLSKMSALADNYIFLSNEQIESITTKNYNIFVSKTKTIKIKLNGIKTKFYLLASVSEKYLPYHEENFAKFFKEYSK